MNLLLVWVGAFIAQFALDFFMDTRFTGALPFFHRVLYSLLLVALGALWWRGRKIAAVGLGIAPLLGALTTPGAFVAPPASLADAGTSLAPLALIALAIPIVQSAVLRRDVQDDGSPALEKDLDGRR